LTKRSNQVGSKKRAKRTLWNPKVITVKSITIDFHDLENNMTELSSIIYDLYEKSQEEIEKKESA
jgi:hypothetical protein